MLYQEAKIENGQLVITKTKQMDQNRLTSNCWAIQFNGLTACKGCKLQNTPSCGGGETLKRLLQ